jgi:uncharacterized protein YlxW (UPF0749 family)
LAVVALAAISRPASSATSGTSAVHRRAGRAGGARAMQIMDQRVIATSAVRCVGNTLLLHGVVYSPPYVITAVGDPTALRHALDASPDVQIYKQYVSAYQLGYDLKVERKIKLPAYTGPLELQYAQAVTG